MIVVIYWSIKPHVVGVKTTHCEVKAGDPWIWVSGGVQAEQGFRLKNCLHPEVAEFAADAVSSNAVPLQAVRSEMSSGRRLDFSDGQA